MNVVFIMWYVCVLHTYVVSWCVCNVLLFVRSSCKEESATTTRSKPACTAESLHSYQPGILLSHAQANTTRHWGFPGSNPLAQNIIGRGRTVVDLEGAVLHAVGAECGVVVGARVGVAGVALGVHVQRPEHGTLPHTNRRGPRQSMPTKLQQGKQKHRERR